MKISIAVIQQAHLCHHFLLTTVPATVNSITTHLAFALHKSFKHCQVILPVQHDRKTLVLEMFMTDEVQTYISILQY